MTDQEKQAFIDQAFADPERVAFEFKVRQMVTEMVRRQANSGQPFDSTSAKVQAQQLILQPIRKVGTA